jgi:serpin B
MKQYLIFVVIILVVSAALLPPAGAEETREKTDPKADLKTVVAGNTAFAFDLYAKLKDDPNIKKSDGNIFFSPYSISMALGMTWGGTRGRTEKQFAKTMYFTLPQDRQHQAFGKLEQQLNAGGKKGAYQLSVANALWGQKGEPFQEDFLELTNKYYGAGLRELDFTTPDLAEKARGIINGWVEKKTKDKIKDLIGEGAVNDAVLVLTNAIYFKGYWQIQFDKKNTKDRDFNISSEKKVQVPMMYLKDDFKYWGDENLQVIELPYKSEHLSMVVLLPRVVDGLAELEKKLTLENMDSWMGKMRKQEVSVLLPKFKITWGAIELKDILKGMGLPLFGDFTGISDDDRLFISNILHKAFVAVDEKGTEAAAATAVVIGKTSIGPIFRADHPFIFIIKDNISQSILFMGKVANPAIKAE